MASQLKLDDLQSYDGPLFSPAPEPLNKEQRQSPRTPFVVKAVLVVDGTALDIETVDISVGGLCIKATAQMPVGKKCRLSFQLSSAESPYLVTSFVSVIYCFHTGKENFTSGLEFLDLAATDLEKIRQLTNT